MLNKPSRILITTHHRPDGDAMGSSLALLLYFQAKGFSPILLVPCEYPDFLQWLPGNDQVLNFEDDESHAEELVNDSDMIFCLDFNWLSRVEKMEPLLRKSKAVKILIDHHLNPESIFEYTFSYPDASSTSELIFDYIKASGDEKLISPDIATALYCGIMTDTNSFRYESMKAGTHRIIASLIEAGARNHLIHQNVYDSNTENRLRLLGYALKEKLVVLREFRCAYISLSEKELEMFNFRTGDTEGVVNYALSILGVELAALFTEREGFVKISFRSKTDFSVQELSSAHFNGGGHKNASGGRYNGPLSEAIMTFLDILPEYKEKLLK